MSPKDDDKCVLKLYMPRKCLLTDELEMKRESTQCKTYKSPAKRKKSKSKCHRSSSADLSANRPSNFKIYSDAKNFRSSNLNQNNSLLKINKFSFNNNHRWAAQIRRAIYSSRIETSESISVLINACFFWLLYRFYSTLCLVSCFFVVERSIRVHFSIFIF